MNNRHPSYALLALLYCVVVLISCSGGGADTQTYSIGGTVSGLSGSGLVLQDNADEDLAISTNGTFTFAAKIADGAVYAVTVKIQPTAPSQACTVSSSTGTVTGANVTNVAISCSTHYFTSDKIDIDLKEDGQTWVIIFTDASGNPTSVEGVSISGRDQPLYNQDNIRLVLTGDNHVELITQYQDALGNAGTSTFDVSLADRTAVEENAARDSNGRNGFDYSFFFAGAATGSVDYTAALLESSGTATVEFKDESGTVLGQQAVTITYHADTSRTYAFSNPYGSGRTNVTVTTPVKYADVVSALVQEEYHLEVYQNTDGNYIIDYYDASGLHHFVVAPNAAQSLYSGNGNTLQLTGADKGLLLTESTATGNTIRFVNPQGIVVDQTTNNSIKTFSVEFMDAAGVAKGIADLVDDGTGTGNLMARFPTTGDTWPVVGSAADGQYSFTFNNSIGNATVDIYLNTSGDLVGSGYTVV